MRCLTPHDLTGIGMTSQRTRNRLVARLRDSGITNECVLNIMAQAPRHLFLDEAFGHRAYEDTALPIGYGQTLSRPFTVARMTERVLEHAPKCVLEVGTGSGYQTLVLSRLVPRVYSIERIKSFHHAAAQRLRGLGGDNIQLHYGDGSAGWADKAPFDVILLTACAPALPQALITQLPVGGVMIAPLQDEQGNQWLTRIRRLKEGFQQRRLEAVRFVPLVKGVTR
ncbi:protein-L-isoaspartate(D-aspartate) O-methyltransferase [Phytohalomonas tamaricis]|uniref:protein-L-isoaspartate(D-aspartate) O-methyltransferase n=1 Tax=Phytohalomonas tamaricis TaxID=2081032 RepID=UPI000D0BC80A|nr:protein-L-isoaspartate(D-aspartate) O-methyltransferase [Phytohalomonas tamaricis]